MQRFLCWLPVWIVTASLILHAQEDLRTTARRTLDTYYEYYHDDPRLPPLDDLLGRDSSQRMRGARLLREVLTLALEDDTSRRSPWQRSVFWGEGGKSFARSIRQEIAKRLSLAQWRPESLPVIRWYLDHEFQERFLDEIMTALGKGTGRDVDSLRILLATAPHPNADVTARALDQIRTSGGLLPIEPLRRLCNDMHANVRAAARALIVRMGEAEPPPFDSIAAFRSAEVRSVMERLAAVMPELPATTAEFVHLRISYLNRAMAPADSVDVYGWIRRRDDETVELYTTFGRTMTVRQGETLTVREIPHLGDRRYNIPRITITRFTVEPADVDSLTSWIAHLRRTRRSIDELSERGSLTGQFQSWHCTLYEALVGTWLYRKGLDSAAARVMMPVLDSNVSERYVVEAMRQYLGQIAGNRMLVAFAGDRDYARAIEEARVVDRLYPRTIFHGYALELLDQLPRRMDDFKTLSLPTPDEWQTIRSSLTRVEQIRFLAQRLRLLNCFMTGQPDNVSLSDTQFAEPSGMTIDAAWSLRRHKTEVINPFVELAGSTRRGIQGMGLTMDELPILVEQLHDDWLMPTVSFWRDFHPSRTLAGIRSVVPMMINQITKRTFVDPYEWDTMSPATVDREIRNVVQRMRRYGMAPDPLVERQLLTEAMEAGAPWPKVKEQVIWLLDHDDTAGYAAMRWYLRAKGTSTAHKRQIVAFSLLNDPSQIEEFTGTLMHDSDRSLSLLAAKAVLQTDRPRAAQRLLGDRLQREPVDASASVMVEALLEEGSEESKRQALRLFSNPTLASASSGRISALRLFARYKMREPYRYYLSMLDIKDTTLPTPHGSTIEPKTFLPSVSEVFLDEVVGSFAIDDGEMRRITVKHRTRKEQLPHVKEWLRKHL